MRDRDQPVRRLARLLAALERAQGVHERRLRDVLGVRAGCRGRRRRSGRSRPRARGRAHPARARPRRRSRWWPSPSRCPSGRTLTRSHKVLTSERASWPPRRIYPGEASIMSSTSRGYRNEEVSRRGRCRTHHARVRRGCRRGPQPRRLRPGQHGLSEGDIRQGHAPPREELRDGRERGCRRGHLGRRGSDVHVGLVHAREREPVPGRLAPVHRRHDDGPVPARLQQRRARPRTRTAPSRTSSRRRRSPRPASRCRRRPARSSSSAS